jgi:hypothetical protein
MTIDSEDAANAARFCDYLRGLLFAVPATQHNAKALGDAQDKLEVFHDIFSEIAAGNLEIRVKTDE